MSSGSAGAIPPSSVRRSRKYSSSAPIRGSKPSSLARASALRRIVRGQNGHASPSTVTSHANRATFGFHGRIVRLAGVGDRDHVGVVRPLADVAGGEAGKPGAVGQQVVDVMGRHELGARLAVHVDELREEELDALLADDAANLVGGTLGRGGLRLLCGCHSAMYIGPHGARTMAVATP